MANGNIELDVTTQVEKFTTIRDNLVTPDRIVADQLADYVNNTLSGLADKELACATLAQQAAEKHLPNFKLVGARDEDGDGKVDGFSGMQIGDNVYVDGKTYRPGEFKEKHTAKEYLKQGHELLKNNSFTGVQKMENFLKEMYSAPGMTDREFNDIVSNLNIMADREKLPMKLKPWGKTDLIITTPAWDETIHLSR